MARKKAAEDDFLAVLEKSVRGVLKDPNAKPSERVSAIQAGAKIAMIKHKISDNNDESFFK